MRFFSLFCLYLTSAYAQQISPAFTPSPTPAATPIVFSAQTLADLKRLQQAALTSDYAYRKVAHLANNIGPRLSGSAHRRPNQLSMSRAN
jgi:hypothetical protein